ncbi:MULTISPECIES: MOSC domain-containing protein [Amycolatopsis]|uniref:MOSC domain-containing protein n=1 Tax=Amycolatopsis TaxID=1813 RepID=UPI0031F94E4B
MSRVVSVNVSGDGSDTGIDKRPVTEPVRVSAPGPLGTGGSGLAGDVIKDLRYHGGDDQAVYAYAREDLDEWAAQLGRTLTPGMFGENLTTAGLDVTGAKIGERWRIGDDVVLEVSAPRTACRVFAKWLGEKQWVKRFTLHGKPGAYLRVIEPGEIRAGDPVTVVSRPAHDVTVGFAFRALLREPELLPELVVAEALPGPELRRARKAAGGRPGGA